MDGIDGVTAWGSANGSDAAPRVDAFILKKLAGVKGIFRYFAEIFGHQIKIRERTDCV